MLLPSASSRPAARLALVLVSLCLALPAAAQIYRSVDAHGRVTFSDQPPAAESAAPGSSGAVAPQDAAANASGNLPYALRQTMQRYPVVLHTSQDCAPCDSGRQQLLARGIPFTEKTVETATDIDALQQLGASGQLPLLRIGQQSLAGHSEAQWTQYLDAAGYPKSSQLPRNWARPAPSPLAPAVNVATEAASSPAAEEPSQTAPAQSATPAIAPRPDPDNPAGIRF